MHILTTSQHFTEQRSKIDEEIIREFRGEVVDGTVQNTEVPGLAHTHSLEEKVLLPRAELHQHLGVAHTMETFLCNPPQPRQRESLCCSHAAKAFAALWVGETWTLSTSL